MKKLLLTMMLVLGIAVARATPITGKLAVAGIDTFTNTGITFMGPGVVLLGTSDFTPFNMATLTMSNFNYATAAGTTLFTGTAGVDMVTMTILGLTSESDLGNFLNISGTANLTLTGETPTLYDFTLTSTHPDGSTSYTLDIVPASAVPEPASLFLAGIGLLFVAGMLWRSRRAEKYDLTAN